MADTVEDQIIVALRQITQSIDMYSRYLLQEFGLTAPQIATLRRVAESAGIMPGHLADDLHLSPQTMAGILNRLESRGLIVRTKDERDRRAVRVRITQQGELAVKQTPMLLRDRFRNKLACLESWERTQILATLQRVALMIDAGDLEVEPFLETSAATTAAAEPSSAVVVPVQ